MRAGQKNAQRIVVGLRIGCRETARRTGRDCLQRGDAADRDDLVAGPQAGLGGLRIRPHLFDDGRAVPHIRPQIGAAGHKLRRMGVVDLRLDVIVVEFRETALQHVEESVRLADRAGLADIEAPQPVDVDMPVRQIGIACRDLRDQPVDILRVVGAVAALVGTGGKGQSGGHQRGEEYPAIHGADLKRRALCSKLFRTPKTKLSCPRRRASRVACGQAWIPACAGMTVWNRFDGGNCLSAQIQISRNFGVGSSGAALASSPRSNSSAQSSKDPAPWPRLWK